MSTQYVVMKSNATTGPWTPIEGTWDAGSSEAAIRDAVATAGAAVDSRWYLAIPARSYKPLPVTVEQTTRIRIGG